MIPGDGLMSHEEARRQAIEFNDDRRGDNDPCAVAVSWPLNSAHGAEDGWAVVYVAPAVHGIYLPGQTYEWAVGGGYDLA